MELLAAIMSLKKIKTNSEVVIFTDSTYVKNGITEWMKNWKKNGWKTASKKPVKNKELWIKVDELNQFHDVSWSWVKGHSVNREKDISDMLGN